MGPKLAATQAPGTAQAPGLPPEAVEQALAGLSGAVPSVERLFGFDGVGLATDQVRPAPKPSIVASLPSTSPIVPPGQEFAPRTAPRATAEPVRQVVPLPPPRPVEFSATPARAVADRGETGSLRSGDVPATSGLSRQFAPLRLATRGDSGEAERPILSSRQDRQATAPLRLAPPSARPLRKAELPQARLAGPVTPPLAAKGLPPGIDPDACSGRIEIVKQGDRIIRVICDPRVTGSIAARSQPQNAGFFSSIFGGEGDRTPRAALALRAPSRTTVDQARRSAVPARQEAPAAGRPGLAQPEVAPPALLAQAAEWGGRRGVAVRAEAEGSVAESGVVSAVDRRRRRGRHGRRRWRQRRRRDWRRSRRRIIRWQRRQPWQRREQRRQWQRKWRWQRQRWRKRQR